MTISTETVFRRTVGNGVTTAFSFPYHFFEEGDLQVWLEAIATGVATLQVLDTHYTITGEDDPSGGTVTFLSAPSDAYTVVIVRKPDLSQTVNLTSFSASAINDALDRLYHHLQYFEWVKTRTIRLPDTAAAGDMEIPFDRASSVLGFDSSGDLALHDAADYDAAAALVAQAVTAAYQTLHSSQNPAVSFRFSSTTTDADPGDGYFRLNHATLASATAVYLDNKALSGTTVSGWLDTFDDSGISGNRGMLIIKGVVDDSAIILATVTGSVTDGTGYRKLSITPVATGGSFQNGDAFSVFFVPRGADGEVDGPNGGVVDNEITLFNGTSGGTIKGSGQTLANFQPIDELLTEISALSTAPGADRGLFYDHSGTAVNYYAAANGLEFSGTDLQMTAAARTAEVMFLIDGGGATITTGVKGDLTIPFACTITEWTLMGDQSGSIVVDIWKDTYANFPPVVGDSITASAKPTISGATKGQSSTLTGWTTSVAAGDTLRFNVDSITSLTRCTLGLKVTRT
jgi:hypothetical protein